MHIKQHERMNKDLKKEIQHFQDMLNLEDQLSKTQSKKEINENLTLLKTNDQISLQNDDYTPKSKSKCPSITLFR